MWSYFAALFILIFVHEMGHYIVARACGIRSLVFSIGFGPTLLQYTDERLTKWRLSLVPLGGYVRFEDDSFDDAKLWQKAIVAAAGPAANLVFAVVVLAVLICYMNPEASIITAVAHGAKIVWMLISTTFSSLIDFDPDKLSGPVGIAAAYDKTSDYLDAVLISVALSVAIAVFNLIPIPGLDGGHLAIYAIQAVTGKPVNGTVQGVLAIAGFTAMLSLMLYVTWKDIFG